MGLSDPSFGETVLAVALTQSQLASEAPTAAWERTVHRYKD